MLTLDTPPLSASTDFVPNHRILIVEDEEVIRDMIILALEEEGYEALGVSDGRVALELLQSQESNHGESRFDLFVFDLYCLNISSYNFYLQLGFFIIIQCYSLSILFLFEGEGAMDRTMADKLMHIPIVNS